MILGAQQTTPISGRDDTGFSIEFQAAAPHVDWRIEHS
jgi:hypothetical protein